MQPQKQKRTLKPSPFILKLSEILETPENGSMISWTQSERSFVVHQPYEFSSTLLPKYFRHSNYGSFLRQLNFYSFVKVKSSSETVNEFSHPLFVRGGDDQFKLIKRQKNSIENCPKEESDILGELFPSSLQSLNAVPLQSQITSLRASQQKLLQSCRSLLQQGNETIEWGFIKSAQIQNESSHNQTICNKIFDFINNNPHLSQRCQYLDTGIITNLLQHLGENRTMPAVIDSFFRMVERNQLWEVLESFRSTFGREHKKRKSFTIVGKKERRLAYEREELGLPPCETVAEGEGSQN